MSTHRVGFVSLGCPKALVDSERILTQLKIEGYSIVPSYQEAEVVIVNTCGFITSAVEESMEAIGEALAENGKVIVTGCLGVKEKEIRDRFPNVLKVTGPQRYEEVVSAVHEALPITETHDPLISLVPPQGIKLTPRHYAYLKISEGCNHRCTFCIIPSMRGDLVSRPLSDVMLEAQKLAANGVKELLVVAQDTSAYGVDLKYKKDNWRNKEYETRLYDLCEALGELGIWVRLHYVYPYPHVDKIIPLMQERKILPYLDIPLQHASQRILKLMKRPANKENTLERIHKWREICPDITLRSTFIVGFPGETDEDFQELLDFLVDAQLDRVGCFTYSPVPGAKANDLPDPVSEEVKMERYREFMYVQSQISHERLQRKIGTTQEVLIDNVTEEGAIGRSWADAPEIDGSVILSGETSVRPGDIINVTIEDVDEYDLWAKKIDRR